MPRSEKALWGYVRPRLVRYGLLERIENLVGYGTPDVNYCLTNQAVTCEGWIELKEMATWTVQKGTGLFPVDHYTQQQRIWHALGWERGRAVFVLLRVLETNDIMLIDGSSASRKLGKTTKAGTLGLGHVCKGPEFPTPAQLHTLIKLRGRPAILSDPRTLLRDPG